MMKRSLAAGSAMLFVALFVAGVSAQGHPGPGGFGAPGPGGPGPDLPLAQLDLTENQRNSVRDVMERYRAELASVGERLRTARDRERAAIETVPVNEGLVRSAADVVAAAHSDMAVLQARIRGDVFVVLTPEQQAKAGEIAAEREAGRQQRAETMRGRREHRRDRQR